DFVFSTRRRHTIFSRDWSSDVCSSDLTYDPNHPVGRALQTQNLAVQAAYEPGSTLKAVTIAAALEIGAVRENETFYCEKGRWKRSEERRVGKVEKEQRRQVN